jgi:hypothetical protein
MTTRVIILEPDRIVLAIDSLRYNAYELKDNKLVCKLVHVNDAVFSATHWVVSNDYDWDAQELAREALRSKGTLKKRVQAFEKLVCDKLPSALNKISREEYKKHFDNGVVLNAAFVGLVDQKPMLYHRKFPTSCRIDDITRIDRSVGENSRPIIIDGQRNANERYDKNNRSNQSKFLQSLNGVEEARMRVRLEIRDAPTRVGGPVDIVTVDKDGIHWVDRKPSCPELEN